MKQLRAGLSLSNEQRSMVDELKHYLDLNFDRDHEAFLGATPEWFSDEEFEWQQSFNKKLAHDGWLVPHWPEEYGGRNWGPIERMLIREEMGYRRIPILNANGIEMLAPILMRFGTQAQCQEHLPKIAGVMRPCRVVSCTCGRRTTETLTPRAAKAASSEPARGCASEPMVGSLSRAG